jgi:mannose-6-phosphate isomerase-like protein (cupin superfamily)
MNSFIDNIETLTRENTYFRRVLHTGAHSQLVLMSLLPSEEIGLETHPDNDQFFRCDVGSGRVIIDGVESEFHDGYAFVIPAGSAHNVINASDSEPLKLYTIYSPAHHPDGTVHATKEDAMRSEA